MSYLKNFPEKVMFQKYGNIFEPKNTPFDRNYQNVQKNLGLNEMHQFCSTPISIDYKKPYGSNAFANHGHDEPKVNSNALAHVSSPYKLPNSHIQPNLNTNANKSISSSSFSITEDKSVDLKLEIATFLDKIIRDGIEKLSTDQSPQKTNQATSPVNHLIRPNFNDFSKFKNPYLPFTLMDNNLQKKNISALSNFSNLFNNNSTNNLLPKNLMPHLFQNYQIEPRYPPIMPWQMNPMLMSHLPPLPQSVMPHFGYGNGRKTCMRPSFGHNYHPYHHLFYQHQCPNQRRVPFVF
jgi:hypothetical protein